MSVKTRVQVESNRQFVGDSDNSVIPSNVPQAFPGCLRVRPLSNIVVKTGTLLMIMIIAFSARIPPCCFSAN